MEHRQTTKRRSYLERRLEEPRLRIAFEKERTISEFREQITFVMNREGLKRADLASRLGRSRSYVTQAMKRGSNLTIKSMVEIANALGYEVHVLLRRYTSMPGPIFTEPLPSWDELVTETLGGYDLLNEDSDSTEPAEAGSPGALESRRTLLGSPRPILTFERCSL